MGGTTEPTLAFPLGPPTALLASERNTPDYSTRPHDTLRPIQDRLQLDAGIEMVPTLDFHAVKQRVHSLAPGETLLVAWQHDFVPSLVNALSPPIPTHLELFPSQCSLSYWEEPEYTRADGYGSYCYDVIWQVVLQRRQGAAPHEAWKAVSFTQLHQGFAGDAQGICGRRWRRWPAAAACSVLVRAPPARAGRRHGSARCQGGPLLHILTDR